ncbi:MAG: helix-turn-helix domain-containing protein [Bacteroidales bacterium]|nr:helix-turn-helix domain-containing protein [Bacteroidales bacterium]
MNEALSIISHQGFYSLTMANIASHVGVTESALYRHFNSKSGFTHGDTKPDIFKHYKPYL